MPNYNSVTMIGHVTRDPQLSYTPTGTAVAEFGLAVNRTWGSGSEKREETCFVDCTCYGKGAEVLNSYVHVGDPLFIEGRLRFQTWQSQDGSKRSKHNIVVESFQLLGGGKRQEPKRELEPPQEQGELPVKINDEEIPF